MGPCPRGLQFVIPGVLRVFPSVLRSGEDGEFGHGGSAKEVCPAAWV